MLILPARRSASSCPRFAKYPNAFPLKSKWIGSLLQAPGHSFVIATVTGNPEQAGFDLHFTYNNFKKGKIIRINYFCHQTK